MISFESTTEKKGEKNSSNRERALLRNFHCEKEKKKKRKLTEERKEKKKERGKGI